jgi:cell wall-associated NlpC family hydrolase
MRHAPCALRVALIAEARTWIGTPWRHQGRLKGIACDCVGHIVCVPRALGIFPPDFDINGYARNPEPAVMKRFLDLYLDRVEPASRRRGGDVLWLHPRRIPQHLGIYTFDNTIIHAIDAIRGVREHVLDERWRRAISGVWSYRGLRD